MRVEVTAASAFLLGTLSVTLAQSLNDNQLSAIAQSGIAKCPVDPRTADIRSQCHSSSALASHDQSPHKQNMLSMDWLLEAELTSIVLRIGNTSVGPVNYLTDLHGARKLATTMSAAGRILLRIRFYMRGTEKSFMLIAIKSPSCLVRTKPMKTFSDIQAKLASPHA
jgi:hypothetical protein